MATAISVLWSPTFGLTSNAAYTIHKMVMGKSILWSPTLAFSSNIIKVPRKSLLNSKLVTWNGSQLGPCHNSLFFGNHCGLDCLKILSGNNFQLKRVPTFASMTAPQEMVTKTEVDASSNDVGFQQVVLPTNETSESLLCIRQTVC
eukprot:Gb_22709 [translate_table: standard]